VVDKVAVGQVSVYRIAVLVCQYHSISTDLSVTYGTVSVFAIDSAFKGRHIITGLAYRLCTKDA
jgi:hypothetical protein